MHHRITVPMRFWYQDYHRCFLFATLWCLLPVQFLISQPILSISEARKDANNDYVPDRLGQTITVAGRANVSSYVLHLYMLSVFIQDDSAGIELSTDPVTYQIQEGDSVVATGVIDQYEGTTQLQVSKVVIIPTEKKFIEPRQISVALGLLEPYEGMLISVEGTIVGKRRDRWGHYLTIQEFRENGNIDVFLSYRHMDTLSFDDYSNGDNVRVSGILEQYALKAPLNYGYEIYPRYPSDIVSIGPTRVFYNRLIIGACIVIPLLILWLVALRVQVRRRTKALQRALDDVKVLGGLVPICSECKKIRDDKGYWNILEKYLMDHSDLTFSHGVCPECLQKLYPEYADRIGPTNPESLKNGPPKH